MAVVKLATTMGVAAIASCSPMGPSHTYSVINHEKPKEVAATKPFMVRITLKDSSTFELDAYHHLVTFGQGSEFIYGRGTRINKTSGRKSLFIGELPANQILSKDVINDGPDEYLRCYLMEDEIVEFHVRDYISTFPEGAVGLWYVKSSSELFWRLRPIGPEKVLKRFIPLSNILQVEVLKPSETFYSMYVLLFIVTIALFAAIATQLGGAPYFSGS
ncbi:MAG: hypothetical protein HY562_00575 [Ignavibacteriales bacterium]|nr:hypothetical protein [Ignavibacteriales bacterium]